MHSYTNELEYLIRSVLLPVYTKYHEEKNTIPPKNTLLDELKKEKQVAALLKPKEYERTN